MDFLPSEVGPYLQVAAYAIPVAISLYTGKWKRYVKTVVMAVALMVITWLIFTSHNDLSKANSRIKSLQNEVAELKASNQNLKSRILEQKEKIEDLEGVLKKIPLKKRKQAQLDYFIESREHQNFIAAFQREKILRIDILADYQGIEAKTDE